MSSQNSDIGRVLGAMGAPDMAYRSFAAEPLAARESEGTGAAAADPAELFPLLAAALPGSLGAMPAPPARIRSARVPCGTSSTSSSPARYWRSNSLFSPT